MVCKKCGAEMPKHALVCPQCGALRVIRLSVKNRRSLVIALLIAAAVLAAAGGSFGFLYVRDRNAAAAAETAVFDLRFSDAERHMDEIRFFHPGNEDFRRDLIRAGKLCQSGQYASALMLLDECRTLYDESAISGFLGIMDQLITEAEHPLYETAVAAYGRRSYDEAAAGFLLLADHGYEDSSDWLFLTQAMLCRDPELLARTAGLTVPAAEARLAGLIGFKNAGSVLFTVDSYAVVLLAGHWVCDAGELTVTSGRVICTLPGISADDPCHIRNGAVCVGENPDEAVPFYDVSMHDTRTAIADRTTDGNVYTMHRR